MDYGALPANAQLNINYSRYPYPSQLEHGEYPQEVVTAPIIIKILNEYKRRSMLIGKEVVFSDFVSFLEGKVKQIDDDFAIQIETKEGIKSFFSGEITFIKF